MRSLARNLVLLVLVGLVTLTPPGGASQDPLQLGRQALAAGKLDEAESHLQRALAAKPPRLFEVLFALGRVYLLKRDFLRAREAFTQCLTRAPRFGPALVGRARASLFLEDLESGLADLKSAQALPDPAPEAIHLEKQLSLFLSRDSAPRPAEARPRLSPDLSRADEYLALGAHYLARGDRQRALLALGVAQAIDDQNPVTFLFLKGQAEPPPLYPELYPDFQAAQAALARSAGESASAAARKILERRPLFVPARLLLIHIAEAETRFVDALVDYQQLVERIPPVAALHLQVARLAYRLKAFELAECHALRALETEPADAAVYYLLANARLSAGKAEKALQSCREAIAAGFATAPIYYTLGEVHHARMEIGPSLAAFQKALAMDPEAAENIAAFALSSLTTEQYASLRQLLEAHVESHPENINTLYSLGVMYSRDGETEKSKAYFNRVRELAPQQAQAYYNLALIYQREGETALAREAMTRFNQLKAEDDQRFLEGRALHDERLKGREALSGREFARAVAIFTALAGKPSAEVQDFIDLGQSLLGAGRAAEARSAFEKARQRAPHDSAALLGLSRSLELLGEKRAAERYRAAADLLTRPCP